MTLGDLDLAIQAVMGWSDSHLHAFSIAAREYGDSRTADDADNEALLELRALLEAGVTRFSYTYDFGDNWEHTVQIERSQPAVEGNHYPACIAGKRKAPPEDCGGPWGFHDLLQVLANPAHPEHAGHVQWIGGRFDPEAFAVEAADAAIAARFGRP
jgi:hypothetical protein